MARPKEYDIEQLTAAEIAPWIAGPNHGLWIQVASRFTIVVCSHEALITHALRFHDKRGVFGHLLTSPNNLPLSSSHTTSVFGKEAGKNFVNKIPPSVRRKVVR